MTNVRRRCCIFQDITIGVVRQRYVLLLCRNERGCAACVREGKVRLSQGWVFIGTRGDAERFDICIVKNCNAHALLSHLFNGINF